MILAVNDGLFTVNVPSQTANKRVRIKDERREIYSRDFKLFKFYKVQEGE